MVEKNKKLTIGILNEGKNTSIIDCDFGTDIGIKNKGDNLLSIRNKFKKFSKKESIWSKFFWYFIVALGVVMIGGLSVAYLVFRFGWN